MLICFIESPSSRNPGWLDILSGEILYTTNDLPRSRKIILSHGSEFKGSYSIVQIVMSLFSRYNHR
jgi:hypothetical protein